MPLVFDDVTEPAQIWRDAQRLSSKQTKRQADLRARWEVHYAQAAGWLEDPVALIEKQPNIVRRLEMMERMDIENPIDAAVGQWQKTHISLLEIETRISFGPQIGHVIEAMQVSKSKRIEALKCFTGATAQITYADGPICCQDS